MALDALPGSGSGSLARRAMSAELLDADTERTLARRWRDEGDERALHRLVTAYMRLAVSMAAKYRRYGAPMNDLTQEAGVGLMKAAAKFDPERGVRFSTYAAWWIKASIQDYVMRNWSLVRTGSTSSQKSLFFNMRRIRAQVEREAAQNDSRLTGDQVRRRIAEDLGAPMRDVEMMEGRLAGSDFSLNAQQSGGEGREWVETLEDDAPTSDAVVARDHDLGAARTWLKDAMTALTPRERMIVIARKVDQAPRTLESLGAQLGLSKERVRQLEAQALRKMRRHIEDNVGAEAVDLAQEI